MEPSRALSFPPAGEPAAELARAPRHRTSRGALVSPAWRTPENQMPPQGQTLPEHSLRVGGGLRGPASGASAFSDGQRGQALVSVTSRGAPAARPSREKPPAEAGWHLSFPPGCPWLAVGRKPDFMSNVSPWDVRTHSTSSTGVQTSEELRDSGPRGRVSPSTAVGDAPLEVHGTSETGSIARLVPIFVLVAGSHPVAVNNILSIHALTANVALALKFRGTGFGGCSLAGERWRACGGPGRRTRVLSGGRAFRQPRGREVGTGASRDHGGACHELGDGGDGGRRILLA